MLLPKPTATRSAGAQSSLALWLYSSSAAVRAGRHAVLAASSALQHATSASPKVSPGSTPPDAKCPCRLVVLVRGSHRGSQALCFNIPLSVRIQVQLGLQHRRAGGSRHQLGLGLALGLGPARGLREARGLRPDRHARSLRELHHLHRLLFLILRRVPFYHDLARVVLDDSLVLV